MKYLLDPNFADLLPVHLAPWILGSKIGALDRIRLSTWGAGRLNPRVFSKDGYDGIEMNISNAGLFDHELRLRMDKLSALKVLDRNIFAFHACYSYPPPGLWDLMLNPCDNDARTRRLLCDNIRIASELGKNQSRQVLVLHAGHVSSKGQIRKGMENCIQLLGSVVDYAKERDVVIALENLYNHNNDVVIGADDHLELVEIADQIGSRHIGFTFDWGHANVVARDIGLSDGELRAFSHQKRIISDFGRRIKHVHLHYNHSHLEDLRKKFSNNYVQRDEHLPLTRIKDHEMDAWKESMYHLAKHASLGGDCESITLELPQKNVLGIIQILPDGATVDEQLASLCLVKKTIG